ncbi:MAG: GNAT family N-acetyltransferase [Methanobacteriota archaeon]|nr:MAG: GNAT family N-acetyltransferase [Euryarchaeota archaeon]
MARTNSSLRIRAANRRDIPAIVEIATSSVDEDEEVGFGTVRSESLFTDVHRLSAAWRAPNNVRAEEVLVAELQGRIVGCVTVEDRGEVLELINIDVSRERQGQGIGTRMVRLIEERARGEGKRAVTLGTSRNAAGVAWKSLPWWLSRGYHITGEEENEWTRSIGPGTREIRMEKTIPRRIEVSLRDVAETDLPIFFDFQRDSAANYMAAFTTRDPTDKEAFAAHWNRILNDDRVLVKTIVFDGHVVGSVATFVDKEFGKPEVTYWIGKEYWGMGLATYALTRFLRDVTVRPIYGRAAKDNVASIRVLEKCGFRMFGQSKGFANARGAVVEEVILELSDPSAN